MRIRHALLGIALGVGIIAAPTASFAGVDLSVGINVAPPPMRAEPIPPPRAGFEWAPGYWAWQGGRYEWLPGRWMAAHPGAHWVPEHYAQRKNGTWFLVEGHWSDQRP